MTKHTEALRTALLDEVRTRHAAGEEVDAIVAELKLRPEWELVAQAQGLR